MKFKFSLSVRKIDSQGFHEVAEISNNGNTGIRGFTIKHIR